MPQSIDEIMNEFIRFSIPTFKNATYESSLLKLKEQEIPELEKSMVDFQYSGTPIHSVVEEYADCIMCLFDSAARFGVDVESIRCALSRKLIVNKSREWIENNDGTYSHKKQ